MKQHGQSDVTVMQEDNTSDLEQPIPVIDHGILIDQFWRLIMEP